MHPAGLNASHQDQRKSVTLPIPAISNFESEKHCDQPKWCLAHGTTAKPPGEASLAIWVKIYDKLSDGELVNTGRQLSEGYTLNVWAGAGRKLQIGSIPSIWWRIVYMVFNIMEEQIMLSAMWYGPGVEGRNRRNSSAKHFYSASREAKCPAGSVLNGCLSLVPNTHNDFPHSTQPVQL